MNVDDVIFISNEFDAEQSMKIARVLNAHKIKTTTDISTATIIVKPVKKPQSQNNNLIVTVLSQKIEENTEEIIKMYEQIYQSMPRIEIPDIIETPDIKRLDTHTKKRKHNYFNQNQTIAKFNKIQYKHKQILFTRTRHK